MPTTRTTRTSRRSEWEAASIIVKNRLTWTARVARWVAAVLLTLQFLAMLAPVFRIVATIMAHMEIVTTVAVAILAFVVANGYVWAGAQVWQDAKDRHDKKARLHLVMTPVVALVPAFFVRSYAAEALDFVYDGFYGSTLQNESTAFPALIITLILGLALQVLIMWLLIQLPLGVVRRLSMAIRTVDTQPSDEDTDTENERKSKAKTPSSARFVPAHILALLAWTVWLAFVGIGLDVV